MDSVLQGIASNPALLLALVIMQIILSLLVMFILTSRLAQLRQEIKALSFGSYSWRQATGANLEQNAEVQSQSVSAAKDTKHRLPGSLLIEKAIEQIKEGTPADQIQVDLGIDDHYLEILIKQHKQ